MPHFRSHYYHYHGSLYRSFQRPLHLRHFQFSRLHLLHYSPRKLSIMMRPAQTSSILLPLSSPSPPSSTTLQSKLLSRLGQWCISNSSYLLLHNPYWLSVSSFLNLLLQTSQQLTSLLTSSNPSIIAIAADTTDESFILQISRHHTPFYPVSVLVDSFDCSARLCQQIVVRPSQARFATTIYSLRAASLLSFYLHTPHPVQGHRFCRLQSLVLSSSSSSSSSPPPT